MHPVFPVLLLLTASLGLSQCKQLDPTPVDELPPATQTGAHTLGCLVNGKVWTPRGYNGTTNFSVVYGAGALPNQVDIGCYRYPPGSTTNELQGMSIKCYGITKTGTYSLNDPRQAQFTFTDFSDTQSDLWSNYSTNAQPGHGTLTITRLDFKAGIVSGTFAYTLYRPGLDSLKVTQGRFGYKF